MVHSSVLYHNENQTVLLLDLPRSIEEAQLLPSELDDGALTPAKRRFLISAEPPSSPFSTPEPKSKLLSSAASAAPTASAQIAELMTRSAAESALEYIQRSYAGEWCLPRHGPPKRDCSTTINHNGKRGFDGEIASEEIGEVEDEVKGRDDVSGETPPNHSHYIIPTASHYLLGTVRSQRSQFLATAPPKFDLILMDPPWPNRSAKRKRGSYQPVRDTDSIKDLLSQIPVASHLSEDGLVAVWVTNSARAAELLTCPKGIFDEWQVELVGEWIWLKVTTGGEPIVSLDSAWRKPWERLLLARKRGTAGPDVKKRSPIETKVIVAVPDIHSRKPNLRGLFVDLLPPNYQALELFARNLTAGWWSWGDQCLLFQHRSRWIDVVSDEEREEGLSVPPKER